MKKRRLLSFAALIISIAYLYSHIDTEELLLDIKGASTEYLLVAFMLSVSAFLLSTVRWYLFLNEVQKTSFKRTLLASISGYYLITILPQTIGHMIKVRLVGGDYFKALSALAVGMSLEVLVIVMFALLFEGFMKSTVLWLCLILLLLLREEWVYKILDYPLRFLEIRGAKRVAAPLRDYLKRTYLGWRMAKQNRLIFFVSFILSVIILFLQIFSITVVGEAFGIHIPMRRAIYGFVMSLLFASASGIPGGFGANEFGLVLGIGASTKAAVTAFVYKFLFQYAYSVFGAVVFYKVVYRMVSGDEDSPR